MTLLTGRWYLDIIIVVAIVIIAIMVVSWLLGYHPWYWRMIDFDYGYLNVLKSSLTEHLPLLTW